MSRRLRWRVDAGPKRTYIRFFETRQEAVEYANAYYDKTGEVLTVRCRVRRIGRD